MFLVLILSVFARHANRIQYQNRYFVRPILQKITGQIALAMRMLAVCDKNARKTDSIDIIVSLHWVKVYQPITDKQMRSVDTPCEEVSTRDIIVIVPALLEL